jgi:hypothetical protein
LWRTKYIAGPLLKMYKTNADAATATTISTFFNVDFGGGIQAA